MLLKLIRKIKREAISMVIGLFTIKINKPTFFGIYVNAKKEYSANYKFFPYEKYVMPEWLNNIKLMENCFLDKFTFNFLRRPVIGNTMFVVDSGPWKQKELSYLESHIDQSTLKNLLKECNLGNPILTDTKYLTSTNSIHHLYHFVKFSSVLNVDLNNISTIVEFGGGYGNAARIFKRINNQATYIIIDLPIFSFLQLVYLRSIFGKDEVLFIDEINKIKEGKINIVPFNEQILSELKGSLKKVDLFLSTWALSETPLITQNLVKSLNYFGASYILMSYQKSNSSFANAEKVKNIGENYEIIFNDETEYLKDNYYLFCKNK